MASDLHVKGHKDFCMRSGLRPEGRRQSAVKGKTQCQKSAQLPPEDVDVMGEKQLVGEEFLNSSQDDLDSDELVELAEEDLDTDQIMALVVQEEERCQELEEEMEMLTQAQRSGRHEITKQHLICPQ